MDKKTFSRLKLERYLLGELPETQMEEMRRSIEADDDLKERIRIIEESNESTLKKYPAERMAGRIRQRAQNMENRSAGPEKIRKRFHLRIIYTLAPAAMAAVVIFVASPVVIDRNPGSNMHKTEPGREMVRLKGMRSGLYIYRQKVNTESELLKDGDWVQEGDLLQPAYVSTDNGYGVILSVDGNGTVTVHFPAGNTMNTGLVKNRKILLNRSYRLDDAPLFERFFFLTSDAPLDLERLVKAAKKLAADTKGAMKSALDTGEDIKQYSVLFRKEAAR